MAEGCGMHGLIVEENAFGSNPGTKDIARHLFTRMSCGSTVIVAENPVGLLGALRRQWLKLARKVQKERASTLNAQRIFELNEMVMRMQGLRFAAIWPDNLSADVYIAKVDQLLLWAPECKTLYVTCDLKRDELYRITALMPKGSLLVKGVLSL
jgi:hypothetical protein